MVFSPKVTRQGPRPHASCVCPGTSMSLCQGCQKRGAARREGQPGSGGVWGARLAHRRLREALAAGTCSDRPCCALRCPLGPEWPGKGGRKGGLPARKRSAGWPQASLTPRAGPGLSRTGRDKPGVLTPRPWRLFPGDGCWLCRQEAWREARPSWGGKSASLGAAAGGGGERLKGAWPAGCSGADETQASRPLPAPTLSQPCEPKTQTPGGRLSARLPHELSTQPAKSRNTSPWPAGVGWGATRPDPIHYPGTSERGGQALAETPLQAEPPRALSSELCPWG